MIAHLYSCKRYKLMQQSSLYCFQFYSLPIIIKLCWSKAWKLYFLSISEGGDVISCLLLPLVTIIHGGKQNLFIYFFFSPFGSGHVFFNDDSNIGFFVSFLKRTENAGKSLRFFFIWFLGVFPSFWASVQKSNVTISYWKDPINPHKIRNAKTWLQANYLGAV